MQERGRHVLICCCLFSYCYVTLNFRNTTKTLQYNQFLFWIIVSHYNPSGFVCFIAIFPFMQPTWPLTCSNGRISDSTWRQHTACFLSQRGRVAVDADAITLHEIKKKKRKEKNLFSNHNFQDMKKLLFPRKLPG